jgi:hypothetical protein
VGVGNNVNFFEAVLVGTGMDSEGVDYSVEGGWMGLCSAGCGVDVEEMAKVVALWFVVKLMLMGNRSDEGGEGRDYRIVRGAPSHVEWCWPALKPP